ncbi:MAG: hypothetical protein AAF740_08860 [Bacteroidota bacterium]
MHAHRIDTEKHASFLSEERHDPITGEKIIAGDEVVFCAACKSAFLMDSWTYLEGKHCGQKLTLSAFPSQKQITVQADSELGVLLYPNRQNDEESESSSKQNRFLAFVFTGIIAGIQLYLNGWKEVFTFLFLPALALLIHFGIKGLRRLYKLLDAKSGTLIAENKGMILPEFAFFKRGIRIKTDKKAPLTLSYADIRLLELRVSLGRSRLMLKIAPKNDKILWKTLPRNFDARVLYDLLIETAERYHFELVIAAQQSSEYEYLERLKQNHPSLRVERL